MSLFTGFPQFLNDIDGTTERVKQARITVDRNVDRGLNEVQEHTRRAKTWCVVGGILSGIAAFGPDYLGYVGVAGMGVCAATYIIVDCVSANSSEKIRATSRLAHSRLSAY